MNFRFLNLIFLILVSCVAPKEKTRIHDGVDISDGVSRSEAEVMIKNYSRINLGCGSLTGVSDGGEVWIVQGVVGVAAAPVKGMYIVKKTGEIVSSNNVSR